MRMAVQTATRQIVMSDRFLKAYDALPQGVRSRVHERLEQLRADPSHPSLNYKAINNAGDARMRSLRVNVNYRIILAHPDGTGTYVLLWVDTHDVAYQWAMRHRLDPGDERRGLAIVHIDERSADEEIYGAVKDWAASAAADAGILHACTDGQLRDAGVPTGLIPALRACATEDDLLGVLAALRQEVAEAVMHLALGEPLPVPAPVNHAEEIVETTTPADEARAPADPIVEALGRAESARRFVVLRTQEELEQALRYPLDRWRIFLHPDQHRIVRRRFSGPALVSGGAGTGKTIVGLHRARYLAAEVFTEPTDRVLLTTFNRNIALYLSDLMDELCGDDVQTRGRIEVVPITSLAAQLRHAAGEHFTVAGDTLAAQLMTQAAARHDTLGLPTSFYLAEWSEVAQEREALTEEAYLTVDRSGRGKALNRRQRAAIWHVLDAYRTAMDASHHEEWPTVLRRARHAVEAGQASLPVRYRAAIVDEAQDIGTPHMRLLLALVGQGPDSLLLLGDSRQQIYARGSYVRALSIPIGRRHVRLRVNYRTTEQIRAAAMRVNAGGVALNGDPLGPDDSISLLSGPHPTVRLFSDQDTEMAAVIAAVRDLLGDMQPEEIAVVARTTSLVTRRYNALRAAGIPCARIEADGPREAGVQVATMHRVKGLEFRAVFIVACSADVVPQPYKGEDDAAARSDHEDRERHLLYVAMTRARERLWMSGAGSLCMLLPSLETTHGHA